MYTRRFYREWTSRTDLTRFEVAIGESDLLILCDRDLRALAHDALASVRADIEAHAARDPDFLAALAPRVVPEDAPAVVRRMAEASSEWGVGPMAAVAGAVAEAVGTALLEAGAETAIVENGGDVFARSPEPVRVAVYAGRESPFADRLMLRLDARNGVGVCASSGRIGPSLSFGRADAAVAVARDAALADAAATAIGNRVRGPSDVGPAIEEARARGSLVGALACTGDRLAVFGEMEFI